MSTINVLIVVDALGAATSGNLQDNVYLVDTNKHFGSGNEGQAELYTVCHSSNKTSDSLVWSVAPVDPGTDVSINSFNGQMINSNDCIPSPNGDGSWGGKLALNLSKSQIQYSVALNIDGKEMTFDPFLNVNP